MKTEKYNSKFVNELVKGIGHFNDDAYFLEKSIYDKRVELILKNVEFWSNEDKLLTKEILDGEMDDKN
jgi:hypothetical protein